MLHQQMIWSLKTMGIYSDTACIAFALHASASSSSAGNDDVDNLSVQNWLWQLPW